MNLSVVLSFAPVQKIIDSAFEQANTYVTGVYNQVLGYLTDAQTVATLHDIVVNVPLFQ